MKKNIKQLWKSHFAGILSLVILSMTMVACDDDDDDDDDIVSQPVAYVSMYQGSPDAPALDILVDGNIINTYPFDYTDYTGFLRFRTGDRSLSFGPYDGNNIVVDTTVSLEEDEVYSIFLAGEYPDQIAPLIVQDGDEDPSEGNAMLRFVNLSPDVNTIDLRTEGSTEATFDDQDFREAPMFEEIDAAEYDFEVTDSAGDSVLLDVPNVDLIPGYYYTFIVRGYQTPPSGNNSDLSAQIIVN